MVVVVEVERKREKGFGIGIGEKVGREIGTGWDFKDCELIVKGGAVVVL
jgi:hypothetical protein